MKLDWSAQGRARVYALMAVGTLVCIGVAFAVDSYDVAAGGWRWGADPVNNVVIPLVLAPPFFFLLLDKMRQLAIAHKELMTVAATDSLTSLLNRRAFTELVDGYLKRVEESDRRGGGALLVIDVDHFKAVNDHFGHQKGDEALKLIAKTIRETVRDTDLVGRVGGEEFCVLAVNLGPVDAAGVFEGVRATIEAELFAWGETAIPVTISSGVTCELGDTLAGTLALADALLYKAKSGGRNRVEMSGMPEAQPSV